MPSPLSEKFVMLPSLLPLVRLNTTVSPPLSNWVPSASRTVSVRVTELPEAAVSDALPAVAHAIAGAHQPLLAERLSQFGRTSIPGGRTDAFAMPVSMLSAGTPESIEIASAAAPDVPKAPVPKCVITSVIDGPNPVVVIDDVPLRIGKNTSSGLVLVGVKRGVLKGSYEVDVMDAAGGRWSIPFNAGDAATPEKP